MNIIFNYNALYQFFIFETFLVRKKKLMFKKAATSISNKFFVGLIILLSSNSFAAWDDLNMTEGVTAISKSL